MKYLAEKQPTIDIQVVLGDDFEATSIFSLHPVASGFVHPLVDPTTALLSSHGAGDGGPPNAAKLSGPTGVVCDDLRGGPLSVKCQHPEMGKRCM